MVPIFNNQPKTASAEQMGEFLKALPKNEGNQGSLAGKDDSGNVLRKSPEQERPMTYAEIGISGKQAQISQKLADIPAEEFWRRPGC